LLLEEPGPADRAGWMVRVFLVSLIALNVLAVILDSIASVAAKWARPLRIFEISSAAVFTAEYLLRIWVVAEREEYGRVAREKGCVYIGQNPGARRGETSHRESGT